MFILSCSAALAFGLFPFAAGQSVASGDRGKMETAPRPGLECLQVTLLIRQMVLDRYDSTGTGILSEQDKARLVEDARSARREARKAFLRKFDKDGDGRLSPEEYRAFREHVEKGCAGRMPGRTRETEFRFTLPPRGRKFLRRPLRQRGWKCPWWKFARWDGSASWLLPDCFC